MSNGQNIFTIDYEVRGVFESFMVNGQNCEHERFIHPSPVFTDRYLDNGRQNSWEEPDFRQHVSAIDGILTELQVEGTVVVFRPG